LLNKHASHTAADIRNFYATVWAEAAREFQSCGVILRTVDRIGEILSYPSGRPRFPGLERSMVNVVLTDRIPLDWDNGRGLAGIAAIYEGYHLIVIATGLAHPNRVPLLAVNTVVHELLHMFRGDVFAARDGMFQRKHREASVDWQATRLWLFNDGSGIQERARAYLRRLPGYFR
jgi:hypothetical protein